MQTFLRRLEILNFLTQRKSSRLNAVGTDIIVQHLRDAGYLENSSAKARSQFRLVQRDLRFLLGDLIDDEYENDFGLRAQCQQPITQLNSTPNFRIETPDSWCDLIQCLRRIQRTII